VKKTNSGNTVIHKISCVTKILLG